MGGWKNGNGHLQRKKGVMFIGKVEDAMVSSLFSLLQRIKGVMLVGKVEEAMHVQKFGFIQGNDKALTALCKCYHGRTKEYLESPAKSLD